MPITPTGFETPDGKLVIENDKSYTYSEGNGPPTHVAKIKGELYIDTLEHQTYIALNKNKDDWKLLSTYSQGEEPPEEPPPEGDFVEDFESDWIISYNYNPIITENFETNWTLSDGSTVIATDDFEQNWFYNYTYIISNTENFEDISWEQ